MKKSDLFFVNTLTASEVVFPKQFESVGTCPRCGKDVANTPKAFACEDKACGFILWKDNKFFTSKGKEITETVAKDLLSTGQTFLKDCYSQRTNKKYDCTVFLVDKGEKYVSFKMEFEKEKQGIENKGGVKNVETT